MKKTKTQKGITLIALIITIVVLLILAVVAINAVQGDGIISHAKNAQTKYQAKSEDESSVLSTYGTYIDDATYAIKYTKELEGWEKYAQIVDSVYSLKAQSDRTGDVPDVLVIPYEVTTLQGISTKCTTIKEVIMPDTISEIKANCFDSGYSLTKINLSRNLTKIGASAFNHCENLQQITIPASATNIGQGAFMQSGLKSITFEEGYTSLNNLGVFGRCYVFTNNYIS